MGRPTGLEPATTGSTIRCSNQLSYDRHRKETVLAPPLIDDQIGSFQEKILTGFAEHFVCIKNILVFNKK
jgi:hypothetical protein